MPAVTERRAGILGLVVREYIETATPVGSKAIRDKYALPASSATIRNEMQALEEEGLLTHPHPSAGRVPSDLGYRYFVESLMGLQDISDEEKRTIRHQFYQAAPELDEWSALASVLLSRSLGLLAVVTLPRSVEPRVRRLEVIGLNAALALLVVVLQEARVLKQLVVLDTSVDQEQLSDAAERLNHQVAGKSLAAVRAQSWEGLEAPVAGALIKLLEEEAVRHADAHIEGLVSVLEQPEFQEDHARAIQILSLLDQQGIDRVMPVSALAASGVSVVIGDENRAAEMQQCSVVVAPYGVGTEVQGFVGLVGPTRMQYGRAVAEVRHMSALLQEMMLAVYG